MKRSPSPNGSQEAEKKSKKEGSHQIEQSIIPGRSVNVKDKAIKNFIELADHITARNSIEVEEKFGIRSCLRQLFDKDYVLGSDGEFEFKLKYVLLRLEPKSANLIEFLEFLINNDGNATMRYPIGVFAKKRAILIYLMFGPVAKVEIKGAAEETGSKVDLIWTMWREPLQFLEVSEDFKNLAEVLSKLYGNRHLEPEVMEALLTDLSSSNPREPWSDQSIAQLLFFMSKKSRNWYLATKQLENNVLSSAEVPGILAHLLFTASHLNVKANEIYDTITNCVSRISSDSEHKKTFMKSLWHELTNHLRDVSNFDPNSKRFKFLAMRAISEFGKFLMTTAFNEEEEMNMEE